RRWRRDLAEKHRHAGKERSPLRQAEVLLEIHARRVFCGVHFPVLSRVLHVSLKLEFAYCCPCGPAHCEMRKITNSAGRTMATPVSVVTRPRSRSSGGLVSSSHFT